MVPDPGLRKCTCRVRPGALPSLGSLVSVQPQSVSLHRERLLRWPSWGQEAGLRCPAGSPCQAGQSYQSSATWGLDSQSHFHGKCTSENSQSNLLSPQGHNFWSFCCKIVLIYKQVAKIAFLFHKELEIEQHRGPALCKYFASEDRRPILVIPRGCHSIQSCDLLWGSWLEKQKMLDKFL